MRYWASFFSHRLLFGLGSFGSNSSSIEVEEGNPKPVVWINYGTIWIYIDKPKNINNESSLNESDDEITLNMIVSLPQFSES
jgi:hypothetical protein